MNKEIQRPRKTAGAADAIADRTHMVAEAAYYKAAQRGFAPGHELADWLAAEADIAELSAPAPKAKAKAVRKRKQSPAAEA